jgi:hypothetical protein
MNLGLAAKAFMLLAALSLVSYGLSAYINSALGLGEQSIFNEAWKLIALSAGVAVLAGFAQPSIRGIKRGDMVIVLQGTQGLDSATALESGKIGNKIKVVLHRNGAKGEGIITAYQGVFMPPAIKLVESERFGVEEK